MLSASFLSPGWTYWWFLSSCNRRRNHGCGGCSCIHNIQPVGADNVFCTTIFWIKNTFSSQNHRRVNVIWTRFRNTLVNVTAQVATKTQKGSDTGFITVPYCLWNLGIPSPERQRRVLDSAPCTHNVPDVPTPVARANGTESFTGLVRARASTISVSAPVLKTEFDRVINRSKVNWWLPSTFDSRRATRGMNSLVQTARMLTA